MDLYSKQKRSEIMSKIHNKETKLEIKVRKAIWKAGFRYRKNCSLYFGKPDIVLKKYETVIFVDSCFWHGCKKHYKAPTTRKRFWTKKIGRNKTRDKEVNLYYRKMKWKVIRIWEHDLKKNSIKQLRKNFP